jgi:O-methyltransferase
MAQRSAIRTVARTVKRVIRRRHTASGGSTPYPFESSLSPEEKAVIAQVEHYSISSPQRLTANMDAATYVAQRGIPGALVECGVWRGGAVLSMIRALQRIGVDDRDFYLFDTFEGMTRPSTVDTSRFNESALTTWEKAKAASRTAWDQYFRKEIFTLAHVREVVLGTGYPSERVHFIVGRVEDTIPAQAPEQIALLRLDTDWYESTKHELDHLYPRLSTGGVLIIDDYGHWDGCRRAVDEYFSSAPLLLSRIDYTGRMAVKR